MKVQKISNGVIQTKEIAAADLNYYQFKGWAPVQTVYPASKKLEPKVDEEPVTYRRRRRHSEVSITNEE